VRTCVERAGSRRRASSTEIRSQVMPALRQPSTKRGSQTSSSSETETKYPPVSSIVVLAIRRRMRPSAGGARGQVAFFEQHRVDAAHGQVA